MLGDMIGLVRSRIAVMRDPVGFARSIGVTIGDDCRLLGTRAGTFGSEPFLVRIGNHVTITAGVSFVTHDGGVWVFRQEHPEIDYFAPITVGDNVFIGVDAIIMPGVTIGSNVVIGAGSVVVRDIPDNSVAAGVPARVIRSIDEYREKIWAGATFMRSKPMAEKRPILEARFFGSAAAQ